VLVELVLVELELVAGLAAVLVVGVDAELLEELTELVVILIQKFLKLTVQPN